MAVSDSVTGMVALHRTLCVSSKSSVCESAADSSNSTTESDSGSCTALALFSCFSD
jgi:hypothetical protein